MAVPKEIIEKIKKEIAHDSPEMEGVEPTVSAKELSLSSGTDKKIRYRDA